MHNCTQNTQNILLADDDEDDCLLFKGAMEELFSSVKLNLVNDGEQLIRWLGEKIDSLPDVLFLDMNMPRKNGFECLSEIKANESLRHIPVIIISTSLQPNQLNTLYNSGAHYYICKPVAFSQLKNVIQQAFLLINNNSVTQPAYNDFVLKQC